MKRWLSLLLALTMLLAMASTASAAEITDLNTYETTNQEMQHFNIFYSQSKTELDVLSNCIDGLLTNDTHGNLVANSAKEWYSEDGARPGPLSWRMARPGLTRMATTRPTLLLRTGSTAWSGC